MPNNLLNDYRDTFFETLLHILEKEEYFDVYILCKNDVLLGAHRVVLCSASPFFKSKFEYEATGSKTNIVMLQDIDSVIMKIVIRFIYSGVLTITEDTVQDLLMAADFIGLTCVVSECCEFLRLNFDPTNIIGIHNLATQMSCKVLQEKSDQFRNAKFLDVIKYEEFLEMSSSSVIKYLSSSDLHVESEQQVFEAAMKWIMHDSSRKDSLIPVMNTIRFPLLSQNFLDLYLQNFSDKYLRFFLKKYISEMSLPNGQQLSSVQRNVLSEKYTFRKSIKKTVYIIGGHIPERWSDNSTLNSIMFFDSNQLRSSGQLTQQSAKLNEARSGHCIAVVDRKAFIFGGEDNSIMLNSAECWEQNDSICKYLPPMTSPRLWAAACSVANLIYIVGGLVDGFTIEKKIDIYNTWTDNWQSPVILPDEFNACYGMGVVFVNGLIYMIGGINKYSKAEEQCLVFNPVTETFDRIASMLSPRARFGASHLGNYIYAVGGIDGDQVPMASVERYSINDDKWEHLPPLRTPRYGMGMVAMEGELFVVGGEARLHQSFFAENYKPDINIWTSLRCETGQRKDFCMVVI